MTPHLNTHVKNMQRYFPPLGGRAKYTGTLLDFNERTIPPSKKVEAAITGFMKSGGGTTYPYYEELIAAIANYNGVQQEQITMSSGGAQGIDFVMRAFAKKGKRAIIPSPSFPLFFQYAQLQEADIVSPLYQQGTMAFPFEEVMNAIDAETSIIVLCNPNNPTGTPLRIAKIEAIVQKAPHAAVLVDEAYFEFSQNTALPLLQKYNNLIVLRTFSKAFGLAGFRIGYLISNTEIQEQIEKIRSPYNVNMAAVIAASAALEDREDMEAYRDEVMKKAKPFFEDFLKQQEIPFFESQGNFILCAPKNSETAFQALKKNGFLVRPQSAPEIAGTLRITIGTAEQMSELIRIFPV